MAASPTAKNNNNAIATAGSSTAILNRLECLPPFVFSTAGKVW